MTEDPNFTEMVEAAEAATPGPWELSGTVVWVEDVEYGMEPDCCGCFNRDGSCCGNAVPRQTEELVQREIANADGRDARHIALSNPQAVLKLHAALVEARRERDEARVALEIIDKGDLRKTEYPNTYAGGFDAACSWAGSVARNGLRRAALSANTQGGSEDG